jgi:N utilization substance protein A
MELTERELSFFSIFEAITRMMPSDFVESGEMLIFVVEQPKLGQAIGKNGSNINKLKERFKKRILIVADSDDAATFIRNFFNNTNILSIEQMDIMNEKTFVVTVDEKDRGIVIGRSGERIKSLKTLLKKKFNASIHLKTRRMLSTE